MNGKRYPSGRMEDLTTAVFNCIDPRVLESVIRFLAEELGLPLGHYTLINTAGGAAGMARRNREKADRAFKQAEFPLTKFTQIGRVVFIIHDDCGLYNHLHHKYPDFFGTGCCMTDRQVHDHRTVAMMIKDRWQNHRIEIYRAVAVGEGPQEWEFEEVYTIE